MPLVTFHCCMQMLFSFNKAKKCLLSHKASENIVGKGAFSSSFSPQYFLPNERHNKGILIFIMLSANLKFYHEIKSSLLNNKYLDWSKLQFADNKIKCGSKTGICIWMGRKHCGEKKNAGHHYLIWGH